MSENRKVFWCDCGDMGHSVCFDKDEDGFVSVYYQMNHFRPWYKRLVLGVKYIFGINTFDYHYLDIVLSKKEATELKEYLEE